jgi:hypothetical protein
MYADPQFGWPTRISGALRGFDVPGGHSTMLQEPHVAALATLMQAEIDRVETPTTLSAQLRLQAQAAEAQVAAAPVAEPQRAADGT